MFAKISSRLRKREGFTLIELLVVVAIIGLLATLAMPRVFESIKKAKKAQGDADLHTISTAVEQLFMNSTDTKYPTTTSVQASVENSGLLKAHAKGLKNPFGRGYIYVTDANRDWYALIDPAETTTAAGTANDNRITLTCGTKTNTVAIDVAATFTTVIDTAITSADVKGAVCTAANKLNQNLTVITN